MVDEEEDDSVDLILRHVSHQFPDDVARGLLAPAATVKASVFESQVAARHRELDRTLDVQADGERLLLHVEWQDKMPSDMPYRVYEYEALLSFAVAAEHRKGSSLVPPIESVVVLLSGREEPWPELGSYRISRSNARFSGVHFRVEPVYQRTIAELEARASPFWLIFAPLAVDADKQGITRVVEELRGSVSPRAFEELGVAMAVLAEADGRANGLRNVIRSLLPKELVMRNWIFKEGVEKGIEQGIEKGIEKGIEQGIEPLVLIFEGRLSRKLNPAERVGLTDRVRENGAKHVSDAVLNLSRDDLEAWLAAKSTH